MRASPLCTKHAAESLLPEGAAPGGFFVIPGRESLFEGFHEEAHVPHAFEEGFAQGFGGFVRADFAELLQLPAQLDECFDAVDAFDFGEQFLVRGHDFGTLGHLDEDVEVVAHDAVSHHAHAVEALVFAHHLDEHFLLRIAKDELPVHHPRNAVVIRLAVLRLRFQSSCSHGVLLLFGGEESGGFTELQALISYFESVSLFCWTCGPQSREVGVCFCIRAYGVMRGILCKCLCNQR